MDQTPEILPEAEAPGGPLCAHCGVPLHPGNQPAQTLLCSACRVHYIKFPFPVWVRVFGGVVLLLLVLALFSLPHTLGVGIHYKRGEAAEEKRNYLTAQRELEKVVRNEPSFVKAQCRLLIAAFYNNDLSTVAACYQKLNGEKMEDDELFKEVNRVIRESDHYYPQEKFTEYLEAHHLSENGLTATDCRAYLDSNSSDQYASMLLVNQLYDEKEYAACDSLLNASLRWQSDYRLALQLKMPLKRELGQQDSSVYYANKLLALNHEDVYAYASKTKALLKQHKDKEALACARKGYAIDDKNDYMLGTLALAYHFNRQPAQRDKILLTVTNDSTNARMLSGIHDIVSGKDKYRD